VIDFLLGHYSLLTHLIEFIAAITGLLCYKKYKNSPAKTFIFFLLFIALFDSLGNYTDYVKPEKALHFLINTKLEKNHWWYTLFWDVGAIVFISYFFHSILKNIMFKKILIYLRYGFFIFSIIYICFNWDKFFIQFFEIFDILGGVIVFTCSVFYFIETLGSEDILEFYKSIYFYIAAVIFIWWLIISPLTFYDIYFKYDIKLGFVDEAFRFLRYKFYLFANIFMYLTYTFAFIWCKPENKL